MNHEEAFIQEVRAHPKDVMARLIYADYLEEAGHPQGELIRLQVELSQLPPNDSARVPLETREQAILDTHAETWLAPLRALGVDGISRRCFQQGLIERVRIRTATFLENGEELCRISPALFCLDLRADDNDLERLAMSTLPTQITSLDLSANGLAHPDMLHLAAATWQSEIAELNLQFNKIDDEAIAALCSSAWKKLEHLELGANQIGPNGMKDFGRWPTLKNITRLGLNVNQLGDDGVRTFSRSKHLANLEQLDLASNKIGNEGVLALAKSSGFKSLKRLNLRSNQIMAAGCQRLLDSQRLAHVETIDVRSNGTVYSEDTPLSTLSLDERFLI